MEESQPLRTRLIDIVAAIAVLGAIAFVFWGTAGFLAASAPTTAPTLLAPAANITTTNVTPTFSWTKVPGARLYTLQVTESTDSNFVAPTINLTQRGTSYTPTTPLSPKSYRWRVRGQNTAGVGPWSSIGTFTVGTTSSSTVFADDFSAYSTGSCLADGSSFGSWTSIYNGFGCVQIETDGYNKWLHEAPKQSTSSGETHAALVVGPTFSGALTLEAKVTTVQQLRTGSPPNPWEVVWLVWHYTDDDHFYYFIPKPNGWELGKRDPAYPGGQRFLATGSSPTYPVNQSYMVKVSQTSTNTITVSVNGSVITTFTDAERPYSVGRIGLYDEDAHVHFDDVKVSQP